MYDPVTLDQLRALVSVAQEGSFSAAARKLSRVQSAVSTAMANLEEQLGLTLWDRSQKRARLTAQGDAVLTAARRVLDEVDGLRRLSASLSQGLEASVSLCLDALFPLDALTSLCGGFARAFPSVDLRIEHQVMSGVPARVREGSATLGVATPAAARMEGLEKVALAPIRMLPVVSPQHPLAKRRGRLPTRLFADAIQIVLSEGGLGPDARDQPAAADQAVLSPRTWRVGSLEAKHQLLRAGLGWGNLPEHLVRDDLKRRKLVALRPEAWGEHEHTLVLSAIYRSDAVFGPAQRWLLDQLRVVCPEALRA
jgi:DNA-binding transcriptional LysR family regulator